MAVLSGAYETYETAGDREDLTDVIYNIDPIECPFMSSIERTTARAVTHEWQMDELDTPAFNVVDEGNEAAFSEPFATLRAQNINQISEKTVAVSGTLEAIDKAGRGSEVGYQLAKMSRSLKRDMEFTLTRNQAPVTGGSGTPRELASAECWIGPAPAQSGVSTSNRGAGGADATFAQDGAGSNLYPTTSPTPGTPRVLLESQAKSVIQAGWTNGGEMGLIMTGAFNKTNFSAFSGNSTRFDRGEDKKLFAGIDIYVSDFGDHRVVPNRFMNPGSMLFITPSHWSVAYLRPFMQKPLADTGDHTKRMMNVEYTLRCNTRYGSGIVADLSTS